MRRFRAVLLALVMLLATVGLTITTTSSAQAASCSGTLIQSYPVYSKTNGKKMGLLHELVTVVSHAA